MAGILSDKTDTFVLTPIGSVSYTVGRLDRLLCQHQRAFLSDSFMFLEDNVKTLF